MKKGLIKGLKGLCCMALAAAISLTGIQMPHSGGQGSSTVKVAEAASTTGRVPMWAYMKSGSGRLTTYTTNTLKSSTGYIVPGDYCKILAFYSNGSVKVTYPVSKGNRTAYASMSGFMASTGFTTQTRTLGKKIDGVSQEYGKRYDWDGLCIGSGACGRDGKRKDAGAISVFRRLQTRLGAGHVFSERRIEPAGMRGQRELAIDGKDHSHGMGV